MNIKQLCRCLLVKSYKLFGYQTQENAKKVNGYVTNEIIRNQIFTCCKLNNKLDVLHLDSESKNSVDRILSSSLAIHSSSDAVYLLKALRVQTFMKTTNFDMLGNDGRFRVLCERFADSCHSLCGSMLISGLRSFLEIGMPPSINFINDIELVILSKIKEFTMTDLIGCLHLHNKFISTNRQKQVIALLIQEISQKIKEIYSEPQIIMLTELLHLFETGVQKEIQENIIKLLPSLKNKSLIKIICTLAENAKRNKFLLNTVGFELRQRKEKPDLKDTVSILYSLKTLNYVNPNFLTYLTYDREVEINNVQQPSIISGLLNACGQLKWRHSGMLNACGSWILDHITSCSSREFVSYLLTTAALNYTPENSSIINGIKDRLKIKDVTKDVWLDVVWSLAILNALDKNLLIDVLSPQFYSTLLDHSKSPSLSNKLKLLNLKSILKIQYPEFVFSCDLFLDAPQIQKSEEEEKYKKSVLETLSLFVPNEKHMCTNINSDMGIVIDAEFIMENKGKSLPLSEYGLMSKPTTAVKNLPPGAKRIALMILLFKDFTLNEKELTGINALALRILRDLGYVVVEIPYASFVKNKTLVKKVLYLSEAIKNATKLPSFKENK